MLRDAGWSRKLNAGPRLPIIPIGRSTGQVQWGRHRRIEAVRRAVVSGEAEAAVAASSARAGAFMRPNRPRAAPLLLAAPIAAAARCSLSHTTFYSHIYTCTVAGMQLYTAAELARRPRAPQCTHRLKTRLPPRMGTHPSGPAVIAGSGKTLASWIGEHPAALGDAVNQRFNGELPYLFKVGVCVGGGGWWWWEVAVVVGVVDVCCMLVGGGGGDGFGVVQPDERGAGRRQQGVAFWEEQVAKRASKIVSPSGSCM